MVNFGGSNERICSSLALLRLLLTYSLELISFPQYQVPFPAILQLLLPPRRLHGSPKYLSLPIPSMVPIPSPTPVEGYFETGPVD